MPTSGFIAFYALWTRARAKFFTVLCRGGFARLGSRTTLQPPLRLQGAEHIEIGSNVFLGSNSWLEVVDRQCARQAPAIQIGDGASIVGFCTITASRSVVIERDVLVARYAYISDHTHAHASHSLPIKHQGITKIAPVRICQGAWLGQNVVICPGVTVGRNAVIGANSVVRDDVPDFAVAVGAPARVIRRGAPLPV